MDSGYASTQLYTSGMWHLGVLSANYDNIVTLSAKRNVCGYGGHCEMLC